MVHPMGPISFPETHTAHSERRTFLSPMISPSAGGALPHAFFHQATAELLKPRITRSARIRNPAPPFPSPASTSLSFPATKNAKKHNQASVKLPPLRPILKPHTTHARRTTAQNKRKSSEHGWRSRWGTLRWRGGGNKSYHLIMA